MRTPKTREADRAVTALYGQHYRSLVRLAALLVPDPTTAEDIVLDSFVAVHGAWHELPDADDALCYLRRSVVRRSRSVPRQHAVASPPVPPRAPGLPGADRAAPGGPGASAVMSALRTLPAGQREVLVLRYFTGLSEAQIASVTGISEGAVGRHADLAMSALQAEMSPCRGAAAG